MKEEILKLLSHLVEEGKVDSFITNEDQEDTFEGCYVIEVNFNEFYFEITKHANTDKFSIDVLVPVKIEAKFGDKVMILYDTDSILYESFITPKRILDIILEVVDIYNKGYFLKREGIKSL